MSKNLFKIVVLVLTLLMVKLSFSQEQDDYLPKTVIFKVKEDYRSVSSINKIQHPKSIKRVSINRDVPTLS